MFLLNCSTMSVNDVIIIDEMTFDLHLCTFLLLSGNQAEHFYALDNKIKTCIFRAFFVFINILEKSIIC